MTHTEIHFHLLPGVDDGPPTLEETLELARAAVADGTGTIVVTPHVSLDNGLDVGALAETFAETKAAIAEARIPVDVHLGGEVSHHRVAGLTQSDLETIANGPAGARWILLEASLEGLDDGFTAAAEELRARGFGVVMAHPERSLVRSSPEAWSIVEHEIRAGSVPQVNAWSLMERYGETVKRLALRVLDAAPVAAVASDAHGPLRPPSLTPALDILDTLDRADTARHVEAVPRALLERGLEPEASHGGRVPAGGLSAS
jgi:protein-tyrosine phosphatase